MDAYTVLPEIDLDETGIAKFQEPLADAPRFQLTDGRVIWLASDKRGNVLVLATGMIDPTIRDVVKEEHRNQPVTQIIGVITPATLAKPGRIAALDNAFYTSVRTWGTYSVERECYGEADASMDRADYHTGRDRDD